MKLDITKTAFVSLYKEFGNKYPYTHKEIVACCGEMDELSPPLTQFQIIYLRIEHELDKLNITWRDWDNYVSLIGEPVRYDYDTVSHDLFGTQNLDWTKSKHNNHNYHTSRSTSDCSHTNKIATDLLNQNTWMM